MILIVCGGYLYSHRADGDTLVYDSPVPLPAADYGLNISYRKAAIWVKLLARDGIIMLYAHSLWNIKVKVKILVEKEIMYLDIKQILTGIYPVVALANFGRKLPTASLGAKTVWAGDRLKAVLCQKRIIVAQKLFAFHIFKPFLLNF